MKVEILIHSNEPWQKDNSSPYFTVAPASGVAGDTVVFVEPSGVNDSNDIVHTQLFVGSAGKNISIALRQNANKVPGSIRFYGVITDEGGAPLIDVKVTVYTALGYSPNGVGTTDSNGAFSIMVPITPEEWAQIEGNDIYELMEPIGYPAEQNVTTTYIDYNEALIDGVNFGTYRF